MSPKELQQVVEVIVKTQSQGYTVIEVVMAITGVIACIVTTYVFIRSVINSGFDLIKLQNQNQNVTLEKQEKTLGTINETLMNYKLDTVKHNTCAQRQENLIERIGIQDIKARIEKLEDKVNGSS